MTEKQYVGDGITVLWHSDRCIHSAHCATTLPRVFRPQERPWIDVTGADASDIRATIDGCPSGALGYIIDDGPDDQQAEPLTESEPEIEAVTVSVTANGPLEVSGTVKVLAANGDVIEESDGFSCADVDTAPRSPSATAVTNEWVFRTRVCHRRRGVTQRMGWVLLGLAIASEVSGTLLLKATDGFTQVVAEYRRRAGLCHLLRVAGPGPEVDWGSPSPTPSGLEWECAGGRGGRDCSVRRATDRADPARHGDGDSRCRGDELGRRTGLSGRAHLPGWSAAPRPGGVRC